MSERVSLINSYKTQLNNDFDFSASLLHLFGEKGGVIYTNSQQKSEFKLQDGVIGENGKLAKAFVVCTRPTSSPFPNEKFVVIFSLFGTKTVDVSDGNKIYIEINPELILDPTMIKDEGTSTDFSKGFGIGEIKSTPDYPTHSNYLPLYEIDNEGLEEDKREPISINDAVLEDSTLIADIINQIITVETEINKIETNGVPTTHLSERHLVGEKIVPGVNVGFVQNIANNIDNLIEHFDISDVAENTKLEGFFFFKKPDNWDGTFSGQLMLDEVGDSTQNLVVELHKVNHNPSSLDPVAIDDVVATTTISHSAITTTKGWVTFTMVGIDPNALADGEHIGIRVYMPILNSSNYYRWYGDATQYSNGLGSSVYDGNNWTSNTNMMGMKSDHLTQYVLCRATTTKVGDKIKIGPKLFYPSYGEKEFISLGRLNESPFPTPRGLKDEVIVDEDVLICLGIGDYFGKYTKTFFIPSDTVRYSDTTTYTTNNTIYNAREVIKSFISPADGVIKVSANLRSNYGSGITMYIKVNGIITGEYIKTGVSAADISFTGKVKNGKLVEIGFTPYLPTATADNVVSMSNLAIGRDIDFKDTLEERLLLQSMDNQGFNI